MSVIKVCFKVKDFQPYNSWMIFLIQRDKLCVREDKNSSRTWVYISTISTSTSTNPSHLYAKQSTIRMAFNV
jgi:hypothetical protein